MQIGELAKRAQCPVETIRYYEHSGLLEKPARTPGNYRYYNESHVQALIFIRRCRSLDMVHDEIRALLDLRIKGDSCEAVNSLLDQHITHVAARINELQRLRDELQELRAICSGGGECTILRELSNAEHVHEDMPSAVHKHLHGSHS